MTSARLGAPARCGRGVLPRVCLLRAYRPTIGAVMSMLAAAARLCVVAVLILSVPPVDGPASPVTVSSEAAKTLGETVSHGASRDCPMGRWVTC